MADRLIGSQHAAPIEILVVDDDPSSRELMTQMLQLLEYRVVCASDGEEALSRIAQSQPNVVITDLMMPGVDGSELLRRVKAQNPAIPVLVMSVVDSVDQAVRLLKSGADDYLTKPISIGVLEPRLQAVVSRLELSRDVQELRDLIQFAFNPGDQFVLGTSESFLKLVAKIPALARTDATVVITGESGTGKELVARAIHNASRRSAAPMVSISCATIPDGLWERELFGHVKGAFSDSGAGAPGMIQAADGGTLFLDEVGEIPLAMQAKLLRFLQEKEYRPVGSTQTRKADVRLVSATNRDLRAEMAREQFREDLYYRLAVIPLVMPPLRQRREDIPHLATHFLQSYARKFDKPVLGFSPLALQKLCSYDYPGNIRELENVVQQALVGAHFTVICADGVPVGDAGIREARPPAAARGGEPPAKKGAGPAADPALLKLPYKESKQRSVEQFERLYVTTLLEQHGGNISRAARAADLPRKSLSRIMARHGISAGPDGQGGRPGRPRKSR